MPTLYFTVDSALLRELGEKLIGKPYIALAELVKNSYDADASEVSIEFDPKNNRVIVADNGHGMNYEEFEDYWMRIGSIHKEKMRISRHCSRQMTGSKGVGRLAVQFLANKLELFTVSEYDTSKEIVANVMWTEAISAGDLTKAAVNVDIIDVNKKAGTKIILSELKHPWDSELIQELAQELWWLQPPFRGIIKKSEEKCSFFINFISPEKKFEQIFEKQMDAILNIWYAKIIGKNDKGKISISLEFRGDKPIAENFEIMNCPLNYTEFEIRVYKLEGRQDFGIKVGDAREYLNQFGGVHVYDAGFHLPYYGIPTNDWLKIEFDHSHRLSVSKLLPEKYKIDRGLQFLPTLSRFLGVVNVDTSREKDLTILITRDRLQESLAFDTLRNIVRWSLDFYAYQEKIRNQQIDELLKKTEKPKYTKIEQVVEKYKEGIEESSYDNLKEDIKQASKDIETEAEDAAKKVGLLGPLATVGIISLAVHHETKWQINTFEIILKQINDIEKDIKDYDLRQKFLDLRDTIIEWIERTKNKQQLYNYFNNVENITERKRYIIRKVIEDIIVQIKPLARNIPINTSNIEYILLPEASLVEWSSIFQNVLINAFNAMIDSKIKTILISVRSVGKEREILIQDTGSGVDLNAADELFLPFVRKTKISPERESLGYGGAGLGLTIVKLIAYNIGCQVSFVKPDPEFKTAFSLKWREV
jgi:hypothetical protein